MKTIKLIIAILLFSVSFSLHALDENYIQLVKHKKTEKKKKKPDQNRKYELTLCCITRDEAEYLPEWIEFHIKQGVEHIYIYDNLTKCDLNQELREYVQKGLIDIISWPYEHHDDPSWARVQLTSYKHYLFNYGKESEWCAFIDTDEFLFCPNGKNLRELLKDYNDYQALMVCWILYGTSHIWEAPKGKLIETLLYRANDHYWLAVKPIVKPRYVVNVPSMHYFGMRDKNKIVNENFQPLHTVEGWYCPKVQTVDKIRLNHYVFRDGKFFEAVKIPRYEKRGVSREGAINFESVTNAVYDDCILKCIK